MGAGNRGEASGGTGAGEADEDSDDDEEEHHEALVLPTVVVRAFLVPEALRGSRTVGVVGDGTGLDVGACAWGEEGGKKLEESPVESVVVVLVGEHMRVGKGMAHIAADDHLRHDCVLREKSVGKDIKFEKNNTRT